MGVLVRVPSLAELGSAELTYPDVGSTASTLPAGYRHVRRSTRVEHGAEVFDRCAEALFSWELHRQAGLVVHARRPVVERGAVVATVLGRGNVGIVAPCRVVYVVDEADRRGFAYGTLDGHPESGEEAFVLSRHRDGSVVLDITAFSRPASWLVRLANPAATRMQDWMTGRYLRAVERIAAAATGSDT